MKRNILHTTILLGALALASCSTQSQLASNSKQDDDVYFSKAEAGDAPVYRQPIREEDRYAATSGDDDDYYYYDSYASRINRFGYNAPFNYYDDYYYGYNSPYLNTYAYSPWGMGGWGGYGYGGGWGLGLGYGFGGGWGGYGGWGYSPWGYGVGLGYGYGGWGSPYSYWGTGYGYGGGYWGVYSANNRYNNPRPARVANTATGSLIYNNPGRRGEPTFVPNRPSRIYGNNGSGNAPGRSSRVYGTNGPDQARPVYRPSSTDNNTRQQPTYNPPPRSSGGSPGGSSGGGGSRGGSGGGGGRPARP